MTEKQNKGGSSDPCTWARKWLCLLEDAEVGLNATRHLMPCGVYGVLRVLLVKELSALRADIKFFEEKDP